MATSELKTIGPYEIRGVLGRGGMATVYRAYQSSLDREVAVKVMAHQFADDPTFMERFRREARSIAKLDHPNILAVYDFGQDGNVPYIVTQLLEGKTLRDRMGQPLDPRLAAKIVTQIGAALEYAHEQGLIHRDVKPSNVLMDKRDRAVLSDFGIVKLMEADSQLTATGLGVGTPEYMSPEQGMGDGLDGRSDLYSLGVMLYEMLTGVTPFRADTPLAVMMGHVNKPLPDPLQYNPHLTPQMVAILHKALAKHRDERFSNVEEFTDAFNHAVYASGLPPLPSSTGSGSNATKGGSILGTGTQPQVAPNPGFVQMDATRVAGINPPPNGQPSSISNPGQPNPISNPAQPVNGSNPAMPLNPQTGTNQPMNGYNPALAINSPFGPNPTPGSNPALPVQPTGSYTQQSQQNNPPPFQPITGPYTPPPVAPSQATQASNFRPAFAEPGEPTVYSTNSNRANNFKSANAEPGEPTVYATDSSKTVNFRPGMAEPSEPTVYSTDSNRASNFKPAFSDPGEPTVASTNRATRNNFVPPVVPTTPPNSNQSNQDSGAVTQQVAHQPFTPPSNNQFVAPVGIAPFNPQSNGFDSNTTANTVIGLPPQPPNPLMQPPNPEPPEKKRRVPFVLIGVLVAALVLIAVAVILLISPKPGPAVPTATAVAVIPPTASATTAAQTTAAVTTVAATTVAATTVASTTAAVTIAPTVTSIATTALATTAAQTTAAVTTAVPTTAAVTTAVPTTLAPTATAGPALAVLNIGTSRRGDTEIAQPEDVTAEFTAGQEVWMFVHADKGRPNLDKLDVTIIKDGTPQPVKTVSVVKTSGFNFFSLDKLGVGSYKLQINYNGTVLDKQPEFKVVAAPTQPPVQPTTQAATQAPVKTTAPVVRTTAPPVRTTAPPVKTTAPPLKTVAPTPCPPGSC